MRYSSPLRIYLFASFAFFLVFLLTRNGTLQVRFYVGHVIFILHVHAFVFLLAIPAVATHSKVLGGLTGIWILGYELAAMRNVYGDSWPKTIVKFFVLQASFRVLELIGVFVAAITGFLSI